MVRVTAHLYGIGFVAITTLSEAGAKIVFNDISQELVDKVGCIYELGIEASGYVCDSGIGVRRRIIHCLQSKTDFCLHSVPGVKRTNSFPASNPMVMECYDLPVMFVGYSS